MARQIKPPRPKVPKPPPPPKYRNRGPRANMTGTSGMNPGGSGYGVTTEEQRLAAWTELGYMNRGRGITTAGKSTGATRGYYTPQQIKEGWERVAGVELLPPARKPGSSATPRPRAGSGTARRPTGKTPPPSMNTSPGTRRKTPTGGVASTSRPTTAAPKKSTTARTKGSTTRRRAS